jgi:hypothetical protein
VAVDVVYATNPDVDDGELNVMMVIQKIVVRTHENTKKEIEKEIEKIKLGSINCSINESQ